jgi:cell division inhibitor SepF
VQFGSLWPKAVHDEYEDRSSARGKHETGLNESWDPPQRMCVVEATSFDDGARVVADRFKCRQPVVLNLQRANEDLSKRMVDFCAGLTYALEGSMHPIVDGLFLLTPNDVEVASKEEQRTSSRLFFNRL